MSKKNKERLPHQTTAVGVKESVGDHIFNIINTIVMLIVCLVILYPLWYVIVASFTDRSEEHTLRIHRSFRLLLRR